MRKGQQSSLLSAFESLFDFGIIGDIYVKGDYGETTREIFGNCYSISESLFRNEKERLGTFFAEVASH